MQMTRRRTVLPFLLALAVLALVATGLMYQLTPVAAQSGRSLTAPTVTLTAASNCNPENPRAYLVFTYSGVDGASSYEYRVKWGRDSNLGKWHAVPNDVRPGKAWAPSASPEHHAKPGENYLVQVRAVNAEGVKGPHGIGRFSYRVGNFPAPADVTADYGQNGDSVDYTKARLTWRGNSESGDWFAVQHRAIGERWQSSGWRQASRVDGDTSPYYHDVRNLDAEKGYEFRVAGHSPQCETSPWSDVATLWPVPDAPEFRTSVGRDDGDGHMMGVWVEGPFDGIDYHKFRLGDADAVQITLPAAQQHRFPVNIGTSYNVCVSAGNARGESEFTCSPVVAQISSPIESLQVVPDAQVTGGLDVYWDLIPVVNPTWSDDDEGSTHAPPDYLVAIREAGTGDAQWPTGATFRRVFQAGQSGGAGFNGLKGNTEYEVAVRTDYYGDTEYVKATGRTLMNPVRDLTVGLSADEPSQAIINWKAPVDASQVDYVVTLRKTFGNRRVGREQPGATAVSTTFNGLKAGQWYHVDVKAVGKSDVRSAPRRCYFQQGTPGSQNTVGADEDTGRRAKNSCAAAQ